MDINPDIPEAHAFHTWLVANPDAVSGATSMSGTGGSGSKTDDVASRKTIASIVDDNLGLGEKADVVTMKTTVAFIRGNEKSFYPACVLERNGRTCNKRVSEAGNGRWRCEMCNSEMDAPKYRYILSTNMSDHTGSQWMTLFDESAEQVIGKPASVLAEITSKMDPSDDNSASELDTLVKGALYQQFICRARVHMEEYQDAKKMKVVAMYLRDIDYKKESRNLLTAISQYA